MATLRVVAPDISCEHCRRSIERDLDREPGVKAVAVDLETKTVSIDYDEAETDPPRLREALTDGGYPPVPA